MSHNLWLILKESSFWNFRKELMALSSEDEIDKYSRMVKKYMNVKTGRKLDSGQFTDWYALILITMKKSFWLAQTLTNKKRVSDVSDVNTQQKNLTSLPGPISVVKILTDISIDFLANQTNQSESISPTPKWEPISDELDYDQSGLRQSRKFLRASDGIIRNWISMNWYNIQNFCTGHRCYIRIFC